MAIYKFKCLQCEHEFEFLKVRSDETAECPKCGSKGDEYLEQQVSTGTSAIFKGTGWARDGYASSRKKKR